MKFSKFILLTFAAVICFSCERSTNYSAQKAAATKKIYQYIKENGYEIVNTFPADSIFFNGKTPFFYNNSADSIYFRLLEKGFGRAVQFGDRVQIRYIESTLDNPPVKESYWTTADLPYPVELIYGDMPVASGKVNYNCVGWQTAIRMMKYSEAVAEFIVPSNIGLAKAETSTSVTPYHYKFTFKILPK
jgi:hypothetical protein